MRWLRGLAAPALGLCGIFALLILTAGAAAAGDEVNIDHVESANGTASAVVSVDGVPEGTTLDANSVGVTVDGQPVDAVVKQVAAGDVERSTVLVLDASNSMGTGGKFDAAVAAVRAYLDAVPADVSVGLVTFAGDLASVVEPSKDRSVLLAELEATTLAQGTHVYEAMARGIDLVGTEGVRSILVLSDGGDTGSPTSIEQVTGQAVDAEVGVDVVALGTAAKVDLLTSITEPTGGAVVPADPEQLAGVFAAQGDALAQQLLLTFDVPRDADSEVDLGVRVAGEDGQEFTDSAFVSVGMVRLPEVDVVESGRALVSKPVMFLGAAALFLGALGILAFAIGGAGRGKTAAERRLDTYFAGAADDGANRRRGRSRRDTSLDKSMKESAVAMTDRVVSADLETRVAQRLTGAGSALTASEWILLHIAITVGAGLGGFILGGGTLALLGLLLGALVPWVVLSMRHTRRLNAFNSQLAQTLGLMAGGLQAGLSLPQSVDTVVREGIEPMAGELRRALVEQRLGVDITDALDGVGERMESEDFSWVVMAVRIQREVGGNLAEILHTVADTLRERDHLRRQVKALSAEGRLSGYILTGMPPLIFFYMTFANPDYVALLYTTLPGFILLGVAGFLLALGSFAMSKLAKVEV